MPGRSICLTIVLDVLMVFSVRILLLQWLLSTLAGLIIPEIRWLARGLLITNELEFCLRLETLMYSVFLHLVILVVISAMWSVVSQVQYSQVGDS